MRPHISINVSDVGKSVEFYRRVFGVEPQKQTQSYAKFDLPELHLNFSMQSGRELSQVNHFGIEVESSEAVQQWEKKLIESNVLTAPEKGTDCCYAKQDKVWFKDPDGNAWEVFVVLQQLPVPSETKGSACGTSKNAVGCC